MTFSCVIPSFFSIITFVAGLILLGASGCYGYGHFKGAKGTEVQGIPYIFLSDFLFYLFRIFSRISYLFHLFISCDCHIVSSSQTIINRSSSARSPSCSASTTTSPSRGRKIRILRKVQETTTRDFRRTTSFFEKEKFEKIEIFAFVARCRVWRQLKGFRDTYKVRTINICTEMWGWHFLFFIIIAISNCIVVYFAKIFWKMPNPLSLFFSSLPLSSRSLILILLFSSSLTLAMLLQQRW